MGGLWWVGLYRIQILCTAVSMQHIHPGKTKPHTCTSTTTHDVHILPKEKLAVEVGHVDGVHINDVNVAKASKSKILEELAAQATCTDTQHPDWLGGNVLTMVEMTHHHHTFEATNLHSCKNGRISWLGSKSGPAMLLARVSSRSRSLHLLSSTSMALILTCTNLKSCLLRVWYTNHRLRSTTMADVRADQC